MIITPMPAARRVSSERADVGHCRRPVREPARLARGVVRDGDELSHAQVAELLADLRRTLRSRSREPDARRLPGSVVVPVRFHVIVSGNQGQLSAAEIGRQIAALNGAYSGRTGGADTGVSFRLAGVDMTNNADWFADPRRFEQPLKTALRRGGPETLNLYSGSVGRDVLGVSTFPQWYRERPLLDGVMIDYRSLPGGSYRHFDRGYTAVHEVGHWFGLFHTFENGCESPGDAVDDTPYEAIPTLGCPGAKDTCVAPGEDPVRNFMDYGFDACMHEFTAGQGERIRAVWAAYRDRSAVSAASVPRLRGGRSRV